VCGIAGFLDLRAATPLDDLHVIAATMAATLHHRGPDARGVWADATAGIAFGHTRLSIVDVSSAGAQPMVSASGRFVINYNGEVYNAPDLARDLERSGVRFRGHSDTEVLIEAIDRWGLDETLERVNGMFAFALWDRCARRLHLVRDRLGEKPLYYAWRDDVLLFGSELEALRAHPSGRFGIDRDALATYLRFAVVPAPYSIHPEVHKLPPATVLTIDPARDPRNARPREYWSVFDAYRAGSRPLPPAEEIEAALDELLRDAVRIRMRSDVPLGAFLSGGIDSTLVVALMQDQSSDPVRTFTIGTSDRHYGEADAAFGIARHLQTRHTELVVTAADALAVIPEIPTMYDEPFADSSQIPTFLVAQLARREVTVSLSGDGGDETFGGYDRYRYLPRVHRRAGRLPGWARRLAADALDAVPPRVWEGLARPMPRRIRPRIPATKAAKFAAITRAESPAAMYASVVSHWDHAGDLVVGGQVLPTVIDTVDAWPQAGGLENLLMALDTVTYLPDDILVKLDRATMAVSLEARVPLLDHRVVEFAASLPVAAKVQGGVGKRPLRGVLRRYVPEALWNRPKTGFGLPIGEWLRGPLRPWAEALLDPARLRVEGYLAPEPIAAMWDEHLARRRDWEYHLWDVLIFQAWLEHIRSPRPEPAPGDYVVAPE
jgi:asparagine synthase (glutamine-hydrolysing)